MIGAASCPRFTPVSKVQATFKAPTEPVSIWERPLYLVFAKSFPDIVQSPSCVSAAVKVGQKLRARNTRRIHEKRNVTRLFWRTGAINGIGVNPARKGGT